MLSFILGQKKSEVNPRVKLLEEVKIIIKEKGTFTGFSISHSWGLVKALSAESIYYIQSITYNHLMLVLVCDTISTT